MEKSDHTKGFGPDDKAVLMIQANTLAEKGIDKFPDDKICTRHSAKLLSHT